METENEPITPEPVATAEVSEEIMAIIKATVEQTLQTIFESKFGRRRRGPPRSRSRSSSGEKSEGPRGISKCDKSGSEDRPERGRGRGKRGNKCKCEELNSKCKSDKSGGEEKHDRSESRGRRGRSASRGRKDRSKSRGRKDRSKSRGRRHRSGSRGRRDRSGSRGRNDRSESRWGDRGRSGRSGSRGRRDRSSSRGREQWLNHGELAYGPRFSHSFHYGKPSWSKGDEYDVPPIWFMKGRGDRRSKSSPFPRDCSGCSWSEDNDRGKFLIFGAEDL